MTTQHPIFVSYARKDSKAVAPIVERLRGKGFEFWLDREGIDGSAFWRAEIVDAIAQSPLVIFFVSPASSVSENVAKELALASEDKKPILPVFLEPAKLSSQIRYQIAGVQHVAWHENSMQGERQIEIALQRYVGAPRPDSYTPTAVDSPSSNPSESPKNLEIQTRLSQKPTSLSRFVYAVIAVSIVVVSIRALVQLFPVTRHLTFKKTQPEAAEGTQVVSPLVEQTISLVGDIAKSAEQGDSQMREILIKNDLNGVIDWEARAKDEQGLKQTITSVLNDLVKIAKTNEHAMTILNSHGFRIKDQP